MDCPDGGIGRRTWLKPTLSKDSAGSIPARGTNKKFPGTDNGQTSID